MGLRYGDKLQWGWDVGMNSNGAGVWGTELGGVGLGYGNELQWGWDVGMHRAGRNGVGVWE